MNSKLGVTLMAGMLFFVSLQTVYSEAEERETIVLGKMVKYTERDYTFLPKTFFFNTNSKTVTFKITEEDAPMQLKTQRSEGIIFRLMFYPSKIFMRLFERCLWSPSYNITVISPSGDEVYSDSLEFVYTFEEEGDYKIAVTTSQKPTHLGKLFELLFGSISTSDWAIPIRVSYYYLPELPEPVPLEG